MSDTPKPAIVLAAFGSTDPQALEAIIFVYERVARAFPGHDLRLAFTSGFIRRLWRKRGAEDSSLPAYIYQCLSPLSTLAALQEDGPRRVLVQSLHVADGAEYQDLAATVRALASIRLNKSSADPFPGLALGPPAFGAGTDEDLGRAAEALGHLAEAAAREDATLILMGHGHESIQQRAYSRLAEIMRSRFSPKIHIGLLEGSPGLSEIMPEALKAAGRPGRALLAPLMVVAGEHAKKDLAGEQPESWASSFKARGWQVECRLEGLGSHPAWADLYVRSLKLMGSSDN